MAMKDGFVFLEGEHLMKKIIFAAVGVLMLQVSAHAGIFTFESMDLGLNENFVQTDSGVTGTFSGISTQVASLPSGPASWGDRTLLPSVFSTNHMTVWFSQGLASISFEFGDFFDDDEVMSLRAFDAGNNLVGSQDVSYPANLGIPGDVGVIGVSTSGGPIDHIELWGTDELGQNSLYVDNMSFVTAVPEPATTAAVGLGLVAVLRRRRK